VKLPLFALALGLPLVTGCGGGTLAVKAPRAEYPVSFSRGVRDGSGELVPESRRQVVGTFEWSRTKWTMLWKAVRFGSDDVDVSDAVNAQIAAAKGDAIVHFRVDTEACVLTQLLIPMMVGVIPTCSTTTFHGEIIRVLPAPSAAPPSSPSPSPSPPPNAAQASTAAP
jgi:hypothetical protein